MRPEAPLPRSTDLELTAIFVPGPPHILLGRNYDT